MLGLLWRGMDNNIYTQVGLVLLVGLGAKNAILIVEFAKANHERGMSVVDSVVEAARLRLRPILMTALAFILGVLPLVHATGAGAASRQAIGTAVFYGMIGNTFLGLIFTPFLYVAITGTTEKLFGRRTPHMDQPDENSLRGAAPLPAAIGAANGRNQTNDGQSVNH
jgi:multidrug efflux pump subunit AcrB